MCIRAIDYCPPIDMDLGEYLRALITADTDLVADDKWCYRESLMRSFQRRRIFPANIPFMSEDAVRWPMPAHTPTCYLPPGPRTRSICRSSWSAN